MKAVSKVGQLLNIVRDARLPSGRCDIPQRGVKGIRKLSQLTERCDGYEEGVMRCGKVCDSCEEV